MKCLLVIALIELILPNCRAADFAPFAYASPLNAGESAPNRKRTSQFLVDHPCRYGSIGRSCYLGTVYVCRNFSPNQASFLAECRTHDRRLTSATRPVTFSRRLEHFVSV